MTVNYEKELTAAMDAVRVASGVCRAVQARLVSPETIEKQDKSPVTVADYASQAVVCAILSERLGEVAIVGEEDAADLRREDHAAVRQVVTEHVSAALGQSLSEENVLNYIDRGGANATGSRYWTLDPIDGTKGFLRREQYAIALALIEDGQVVLGVLGCPNLPATVESQNSQNDVGAMFTAVRGSGAQVHSLDNEAVSRSGQAVQVSRIADSSEARFCESVESGHSDQDQSARIAELLGITLEPYRIDSQCKYATVARGNAQIYLRMPTRKDYEEKIWDHAAGMIVVEQAGGRVSDIHGKPLDFTQGRTLKNNRGIVATCGHIHDEVIRAIAKTME